MKRVLCFVGTRPEAIKLAPVIHALQCFPQQVKVKLCSTGQHREMLSQAFLDFQLSPDFDLDVMRANQTLADLSSRLFYSIDALLAEEKPEWILVQGDTTTVMVASLCAFYRKTKVAHIEAGLRSFDKHAPFPEELNRRVASMVADIHFAPTEQARENLKAEGIPSRQIIVTGNTVIDALLWMLPIVKAEKLPLPEDVERAVAANKKIILITSHRRENFGSAFEQICFAIRELTEAYPDIHFVYPVHLNPNIQKPAQSILGDNQHVSLIAPQTYKQFIRLMDLAHLILTDSGGVQEEGSILGKPVLVLRDVTERPEGVAAGVSKLVGTKKGKIVAEVSLLLTDLGAYRKMAVIRNPYGDGKASERIAEAIING